jgi:hypothetical protein
MVRSLRRFLVLCVLFCGCASNSDETARAELEKRYVVAYYDRNHGGRVDFEFHHLPDAADADWAYCDTKFRGRYDLKIKRSYPIVTERVDLPIPARVKITPGKPPVSKLPEIIHQTI